ncbi:glycosyltransferase family 4 protein [Luteolibacter sp. AS25]|uniref:glycosyltransferase family 4 protein n=1 Tax=Luteolibacter sp. AS25 TaxID=3135776 RepID=UPI00398ADB91
MKVLQVLPELNSGGVERGTLEVAGYLVENGHEAVVVSNGGRMVEELVRCGARHIAMPVHKKSLGSLFQVKAFREMLEKEKPDILHVRSRVPAWIAYLAWRKMDPATRPRLVSTVHGFYSVNFYSAVMTKGERVIAVSESIRKYILENYPGTPDEKITVIHRGVSPGQFPRGYQPDEEWLGKWKSDYPQLAGKTVLLLPGRLTRWKGQEDFIRLLAELKKVGMNVHGLLLGETHPRKREFEEELRASAGKLGVLDDLTFLGHRKDVREVMSVADLTLSLSHDPEAFGRVSLEAATLGKPVVGYDHGGVAEQLRVLFPEGTVPVGDEVKLAEKVRKILQSDLVPGGVHEAFLLDSMLKNTLGVYEDLLASEAVA